MSRRDIYYWKCDRQAAFHGTDLQATSENLSAQMLAILQGRHPGATVELREGGGQGNHRTFIAVINGEESFVRIEDGPEQDDHIAIESEVQEAVRLIGVRTPRIHAVDATRKQAPFAWQLMELVPQPDLNHWFKQGHLDLPAMARKIGAAVATWQQVPVQGFGPFKSAHPILTGHHESYPAYFRLNLEKHLTFLTTRQFLTEAQASGIRHDIGTHAGLLELEQGCLVHKDLALWNILGTETEVSAYIDWDDSISGDPMDDLSLLGCFYDGPVLAQALAGYAEVRPVPADYRRRFWLHLLRNMIVKSVIRVGAGYFDRTDGFFLIGSGSSGADLRTQTLSRIQAALDGLREDHPVESL